MNELEETRAGEPVSRKAPPMQPMRIQSFATTGLFVLAVCYTIYFAREIMVPITAAVILALVLQPIIRLMSRCKIPEPLGAGVVVIALFAALTPGIYFLADPAANWIAQMPDIVAEVQDKIKGPIEEIRDAQQEIKSIVDETQNNGDSAIDQEAKQRIDAEDQSGDTPPQHFEVSLLEIFLQSFAMLRSIGWSVVVIFVLLYFLLASSRLLRENTVAALPTLGHQKRALAATRDIQRDVSAYLITVMLINTALGIAIGLAMHITGLPNAALWGAMAAILNFMPYLGPLAGAVVVAIVGLVSFETPLHALLPPVVYIGINALEGNLITPMILGRRLTINPVAVFLSVIFWAWLWGIPGALMAVPLLACVKVICDRSEQLAPVSQLLSGR